MNLLNKYIIGLCSMLLIINPLISYAMDEYGHMLSLIHQNLWADSIMKQGRFGKTKPTAIDYQNVNWKY